MKRSKFGPQSMLTLSLGALSALLFASCASGDTGVTGDTGDTTTTQVESPTTASSVGQTPDTGEQDEGEEILFFGWDVVDTTAGLGVGYQAAKEAWEADTGNVVGFEGAPFDNFVATATTRSRAGELGDVVEILPDLSHSALFPTLAPITKSDYSEVADDLVGWNAGIIDPAETDTYAGVPIGAQGTLWYYNKAIFEEAGLDPDLPPETWDDFLAALEAIEGTGKTPLGMSGLDSTLLWWAWNTITPQFFTTSEELLAIRTGEIPLTDERFFQSLEPLAVTYERGFWGSDFVSKSFVDVESDFAAGEVGVVPGIITSAMNWKVWDEQLGSDAYGVFSAPTVEGAVTRGQFFNPVLLYGLSADTEKLEASRSWISFLASREGQEIMLREAGQFPNRSDIDVANVSQSDGAAAIVELVEAAGGGTAAAQNSFNTEAAFSAIQNLTAAVVEGDLRAFLEDLERLQNP